MRLFAATFILGLFLGTAALAGGPTGDGPEQQMAQTKVVVVQPDNDNTAIYVGAVATVLAAGITVLGVRRNRKG